MKRIIISTMVLCCAVTATFAQDEVQKAASEATAALLKAPKAEEEVEKPNYWTNSFQVDLGFNQTNLWS